MLAEDARRERAQTRKRLREQRRALSPSQAYHAALRVQKLLAGSSELIRANNIALYWDDDGELPTLPLIELAWSMGKKVYLPRLDLFNNMRFVELRADDRLSHGTFGLLSPAKRRASICPLAVDLVIAPLVGFDSEGNRLGRGGGYYDRFMRRHKYSAGGQRRRKPAFLGIAYSFQQVDALQSAEWDVPLDAVITEQQHLVF